ncbi:MAG TPA: 2-C-methyl-D-erythritol 2,4-cyclodiphosphate synthase, partial [Lachnoclostridium phytofermentans]|nr:2-C-methyl-D-erythritol 2,4-cyclodiphosphate synthase [Lachnoclostridium phytofermentans]
PQMVTNIAKTLHISEKQVNVKATTEEGLGFTGSGDGISAQAICLLNTVDNYSYDGTNSVSYVYDPEATETKNCSSCQGCCRNK